jgi:hypothetical protein
MKVAPRCQFQLLFAFSFSLSVRQSHLVSVLDRDGAEHGHLPDIRFQSKHKSDLAEGIPKPYQLSNCLRSGRHLLMRGLMGTDKRMIDPAGRCGIALCSFVLWLYCGTVPGHQRSGLPPNPAKNRETTS